MPSLASVQRILRTTTEALARELAEPTDSAPDWSDTEWLLARAVAAIHGVSPLLSRRSRWQGPAGWTAFLDDQRAHTARRFSRIRDLLQSIDLRAAADGIALTPLKGAALHAIGIYEPGERPMADIDLLASAQDEQRTCRLIEALGFRQSNVTWLHRVFEPTEQRMPAVLGENSANAIKIELHTRIKQMLPLHVVDVSEIVFPRRLHAGLNDYPSNASLMIHLLLHAAGGMVMRDLRLVQLHDVALLAARMTDPDWDEVLGAGACSDGNLGWALPPLALTAHYYSGIPRRVLDVMDVRCGWLLKRAYRNALVSDVSLSSLWITALPGIEWAASTREMLQYVVKRIIPDSELRKQRAVAAQSPNVAGFAWSHMSQSRRILRWLTSRPPRAETLAVVQAALAQTP